MDGDADADWLLVESDADIGPLWSQLVRQPLPGQPQAGRWLDMNALVHQWSNADWQWALIVGASVPWAEVERVIRPLT